MPRPTIEEQIREIDSVMNDYPEYREILKRHRSILEILIPVAESPTKGMRKVVSDEAVKKLLEKAVASKKPLSGFLDVSLFDEDIFLRTTGEITAYIMDLPSGGEGLERLLGALELGEVAAHDAIEAILREDASWFRDLGERLNVEPALLRLVFETPMRPFFEDLARRVEGELMETWWEPICPVCGRTSTVSRVRQRKRYMACTYCGAEHMVDLFLCVHCGNKNPYSLGFISFEDHPEFELNYCEECKHYIKALHEERMRRKIPKGLEDLLTQELDIQARTHEFGLTRL